MATQHRPDELATLRAEFAAFRAAQEAEIARLKRRRHFPRHILPVVLAMLLVALVPLATLATTPFVDLTGGPHDGNIDAIFNAGITRGCDPTHYCPTTNVTREEMASFLARTAGLGGNPPIANAAALGGQPPSAYLSSTGEMTMWYSPTGFGTHVFYTAGRVDRYLSSAVLASTVTGTQVFVLPIDRPTSAFGRTLAIKSVEICYSDYAPHYITATRLLSSSPSGTVTLIEDPSDRVSTDPACYTLTPATPNTVGQALSLAIDLQAATTGLGVAIRSVSLTLTPIAGGAAAAGEPVLPGPDIEP